MATYSERVHAMKENFMTWHREGYSIPEIAAMSHLSFSCVYDHLQEIADENGVTRNKLLKLVRTERSERALKQEAQKFKLDSDSMQKAFTTALDSITYLISEIESVERKEEEKK